MTIDLRRLALVIISSARQYSYTGGNGHARASTTPPDAEEPVSHSIMKACARFPAIKYAAKKNKNSLRTTYALIIIEVTAEHPAVSKAPLNKTSWSTSFDNSDINCDRVTPVTATERAGPWNIRPELTPVANSYFSLYIRCPVLLTASQLDKHTVRPAYMYTPLSHIYVIE